MPSANDTNGSSEQNNQDVATAVTANDTHTASDFRQRATLFAAINIAILTEDQVERLTEDGLRSARGAP